MRVIAGTARSLPLKTIEGLETRPTTDRIKETLFNMLTGYVPQAKFLDLFAGSGGIGIEALSRGAESCTFVEQAKNAAACIDDNLKFTKLADKAQVRKFDAVSFVSSLPEIDYDVIFMDAAKGQYIHFLPDILLLLPPGGLLISDIVLQDGDIIESRFAVTRRNRTIHARMREYLYELKHHPELETVILPVGDGVTLSTKKEESTVTQNK